jgi:hypothetical protein
MEYFWSNTIWFILLGVTTAATLAFVLVKAEDRKRTFAFFLAVSGLTYMAEVTIFLFFKAYDYYPMIFHHISRVDDGLAGNLFSQFSISATALLLCTRRLKFYWYLLFPLAYAAIEELFLYLGIYRQYWYRTWMTVAGFLLLFTVVKLLYDRVTGNPGRVLRHVLTVAAAYVPHTLLITWPIKLLGYPAFSEKLLADPVVSGMMLFAINFFLLSNAVTVAYYLKPGWRVHAAVIFTFFVMYSVAWLADIVIYESFVAAMLFAAAEIGGMYLSVLAIGKLGLAQKSRVPA